MKTDAELQKDIMEELKYDPQVKDIATEIGITAKKGVVTISGFVDTYRKKIAVENAVQRVAGVKVIAIDLEVKTPPSSAKSDIEIATAAERALSWHSAVNEDLVDVKVDNGWIYLEGTVEYDYLKKAAENAVSNLAGVKGVTNKIIVKGKSIDPVELKRKINAAFHRSATVDSSTVYVEVIGGTVTLTGKVRSWAERNDAEDAAWSCPGAIAVNNKIEIDPEILIHK